MSTQLGKWQTEACTIDMLVHRSAGPFTKAAGQSYSNLPFTLEPQRQTGNENVVRPGLIVDRSPKVWKQSKAELGQWQVVLTYKLADFRFNSQPLGVAFTDQPSIGGRAWPNVAFGEDHGSTLHLHTVGQQHSRPIAYWWHSNRQVAGRGTTEHISRLSAPSPRLPNTDRRPAIDCRVHLRRVPRQGPHARVPRRRRPQPRPPGPPGHLRPARLR